MQYLLIDPISNKVTYSQCLLTDWIKVSSERSIMSDDTTPKAPGTDSETKAEDTNQAPEVKTEEAK